MLESLYYLQGKHPEHDSWNVLKNGDDARQRYEVLQKARLGNNYYSCKKQVRVNVAKRVGLHLESPFKTMQRCDTARISGLKNCGIRVPNKVATRKQIGHKREAVP